MLMMADTVLGVPVDYDLSLGLVGGLTHTYLLHANMLIVVIAPYCSVIFFSIRCTVCYM